MTRTRFGMEGAIDNDIAPMEIAVGCLDGAVTLNPTAHAQTRARQPR